jgi:hypothetical protein
MESVAISMLANFAYDLLKSATGFSFDKVKKEFVGISDDDAQKTLKYIERNASEGDSIEDIAKKLKKDSEFKNDHAYYGSIGKIVHGDDCSINYGNNTTINNITNNTTPKKKLMI